MRASTTKMHRRGAYAFLSLCFCFFSFLFLSFVGKHPSTIEVFYQFLVFRRHLGLSSSRSTDCSDSASLKQKIKLGICFILLIILLFVSNGNQNEKTKKSPDFIISVNKKNDTILL